MIQLIEKLEKKGMVKIQEHECARAIQFNEYEDEGICYAMKIGNNQLFFWYDGTFIEHGILPNSKFEIYEEKDDMLFLFGNRINVKENKIQPVKIRREIKENLWGELPEHREIINSTVDKCLNELEKRYSA